MPTFLGIEIGGTKLQLGLGAGDGAIARLVRLPVDLAKGAEGIRSQIADAFRALDTPVAAVGIGFGGPVDAERGVVTKSHQVSGWDGFPLAEWACTELGVPLVALANDADTAALGEARFGAGRGLSPILYVNSGSGIGGGLVIDGRIYRGAGAGAVEIGHVIAEEDGARFRILEQVASGWGIAQAGRVAGLGGDPARMTAALVAEFARRDPDGEAARILGRAAGAMGRALAFAVTLLAPRRVILGGGVSLIEDALWLDPIREALDRRVFPPFRGTFDVVTAALGEDVVVHGALALAADHHP